MFSEKDSQLTEVYKRLVDLHHVLEQNNKGDNYYRQFFVLKTINGDGCKMLPKITPHLPEQFIEKELNELTSIWREYKSGYHDPGQ